MVLRVKTQKDYSTKGGFTSRLGDAAFDVDESRHEIMVVNPSGFNAGLPTSSPVDIRIKPNQLGQIEQIILQETKVEQGTSTAVLLPFFQQFERIEVCVNGSSTPVQTITGDSLMLSLDHLEVESRHMLGNFGRWNCDVNLLNNEATIATSGTAIYAMPLMGILLDGGRLNPKHLKGDIILRLIHKSAADMQSSGTGVVWTTDISLYLVSRSHPQSVEQHDAKVARDNAFLVPYTSWLSFPWSGTLTAGTKSTISLGGVSGKASAMTILIRSSKTTTGLRNFTPLGGYNEVGGSFDLLNSRGESMLGDPMSAGFIRSIHMPQHLPGNLCEDLAIYTICFAEDPSRAWNEGVDTGGLVLDGNQSLTITPAAAPSAGTAAVTTFTSAADTNVSAATAADDGTFVLCYTKGISKPNRAYNDNHSYFTTPLAFGATNATIDAALDLMGEHGLVTSTAAGMDEVGGLVLTTTAASMSSNDLAANGACWNIISSLEDGALYSVGITTATTAGVRAGSGFTTGTYFVDIIFNMYRRLVEKDGQLTQQDSY